MSYLPISNPGAWTRPGLRQLLGASSHPVQCLRGSSMFYVFLNEDLKATAPYPTPTEVLRAPPPPTPDSPRAPTPLPHRPQEPFFNQNQEPGCAMPPPPAGPVLARTFCVVIVAWRVPQPLCESVLGVRHSRSLRVHP
uniref:Uncharacterized protein n=1 Tax=Molossus molossus TaxID=27622 RepID=A0A7J8I831_MOLMO|nr:hypothetical protein HJG59_010567 [Molossus molossus]